MTALEDDERFLRGVRLFNEQQFFEASEEFEELFFEAVLDEVPVARALLQVSVGCLHVERRQFRAAAGRLSEGLVAIERIRGRCGFDVQALGDEIRALASDLEEGRSRPWPRIRRL